MVVYEASPALFAAPDVHQSLFLEAVADGMRTADLGGDAGSSEFTGEVIRRTRSKLEVWKAL